MKRIIYKKTGRITTYDPETLTESFTEILVGVNVEYTETNEAIAKAEAYKGEYTIEDDGQPETEVKPSDTERITELEDALDLLLSGVTE